LRFHRISLRGFVSIVRENRVEVKGKDMIAVFYEEEMKRIHILMLSAGALAAVSS
jgi:hypothetical protein